MPHLLGPFRPAKQCRQPPLVACQNQTAGSQKEQCQQHARMIRRHMQHQFAVRASPGSRNERTFIVHARCEMCQQLASDLHALYHHQPEDKRELQQDRMDGCFFLFFEGNRMDVNKPLRLRAMLICSTRTSSSVSRTDGEKKTGRQGKRVALWPDSSVID